jgi:hypothetical protein
VILRYTKAQLAQGICLLASELPSCQDQNAFMIRTIPLLDRPDPGLEREAGGDWVGVLNYCQITGPRTILRDPAHTMHER